MLTGVLGWPWVFWVNVPIGVVGLTLTPVLLGERRGPAATRHLDVAGAATGTAGLVLLAYGFARAEHAGLTSPGTLGGCSAHEGE